MVRRVFCNGPHYRPHWIHSGLLRCDQKHPVLGAFRAHVRVRVVHDHVRIHAYIPIQQGKSKLLYLRLNGPI